MNGSNIKNWKKSKDLECFLFFALRLKELVFNYTIDTFKYPALNSSTICKEALDLIEEIEADNFSAKSIEPIISEIQWKLRSDYIVKKILKDRLDYYLNFGDLNNLKDIKVKLELLYNKITPDKYSTQTETELKALIIENRQKNNINKLTSFYVSSLINLGFSQSYIHVTVNDFFFNVKKINSIDIIDEFFKRFVPVYSEHKVIIKCSSILNILNDSSKVFNSEILDVLPKEILKQDKNSFLSSKTLNDSFFIASGVMALDPVSARVKAEDRINKLSKLFVFYHHKEHPTWSKDALVISSKKAHHLKEQTSPMSKSKDLGPKKAAIYLNKLIKGLALDEDSFSKYDRAIDLHGLAVENKYYENQLLHNWIAFETLLVGYSDTSKINQVINHLLPFLKQKYISLLLEDLSRSLLRYDDVFFTNEIKKIKVGNDIVEKLGALIVLDSYKLNRVRFYKNLEKNPLLKWRLSIFHDYFGKPKEIINFISTHEKKVVWQIKRMYRSRNLIVHAGVIPQFTEILVENSHTYLDLLIGTINDLSINDNEIFSIEQAIKETQIKVSIHDKFLSSNKDKPITPDNYTKFLFGC